MDQYAYLKKLIRNNPDVFSMLRKKVWFLRWLKKNLHIYNEFERQSIYLRTRGKRKNYSARAIAHKLRWDSHFTEDSSSDFKISNDCTSWLARLVMLANPTLNGLFRTRG